MKNKWYAALIFFLSILLSVIFFKYGDFFRHAKSLGLLGLFIINFVSGASFFVPGPAFLTIIAGGNLYSPILVAAVAAVGACLGDMLGYVFGYSGRELTKRGLERHKIVKFLEKHFDRYGELIIFLFAIIPNPFFDALGILAGIVKYPPRRFFVIVLFGRFLRYWGLAQVGSHF